MLEEVLRYINNRFEREAIEGTFTITGGTLEVDGIEGQHFWVEGSAMNDGLHTIPATDMTDETFTGTVTLLAVPKAVEGITTEIEAWLDANSDALNGPYASESFGGYSYNLASGTDVSGASVAPWQAHFGGRLRQWRRLSRDWV